MVTGHLGAKSSQGLLAARGLLNRAGQTTVAAVLLLGVTPQAWFPQARVRILRYRGRERGSGRYQQLETDVQVEGPLLCQIEEAGRALERLVPTREALGRDGRFESTPIIPGDVWSRRLGECSGASLLQHGR